MKNAAIKTEAPSRRYASRSGQALCYPRLSVQNACPGIRMPRFLAVKSLRQACNHLGLSDPRPLTIRLVDCAEGAALNQQFRGKAYATNVLSFPGTDFSDDDLAPLATLGDLVLCWPVIVAEAQQQQKKPLAHLQHLLIHGFLHLQGFDHEDDFSAEIMERHERLILLVLGLADPYASTQRD